MFSEREFNIRKVPGTHVIRADGAILGETSEALELSAGAHPPIIYFPQNDLAMAFFEPSDRRESRRPAGDTAYYGIASESGLIADAAWSHPAAEGRTARLQGHIAFDTSRVTVERI